MVHQEILRTNPSADLAVYAVWEPSLPTDARSEWPSDVLDDPRVLQFWDDARSTSQSLAAFSEIENLLHADAYALFGPEATWRNAQPTGLVAAAPNILGRSDALRGQLGRIL